MPQAVGVKLNIARWLCTVYIGALVHTGGLAASEVRRPSAVSRPPRLGYGGSANVTATAGQSAMLRCSIYDLGDTAVSWIRKRDLHILTTDIFTYTSDARYQVLHPEGSVNWTLLVNYAQVRDSGVYECQVNTVPKKSLAFYLRVVEAFATIQGPRQVYAKVDSTLRLTCVVNLPTTTQADLVWLQNDSILSSSRWVTETSAEYVTSSLVIRGARDRDSGVYTCAPAGARHTTVDVHVISGEHPAAMQHGHGESAACPIQPHLSALLLFSAALFCSR